jgi:2-isopropylmalate synthase
MIRVNSQSGKAGVATILDQVLSLQLPIGMQADFYQVIQKEAEQTGREVPAKNSIRIFYETYCMSLEQVTQEQKHSIASYIKISLLTKNLGE